MLKEQKLGNMAAVNNFNNYCSFVLKNYLDELTRDIIAGHRRHNIPLLKYFVNLPEEELFRYGKNNITELLTEVIAGKQDEYIQRAMTSWRDNRLAGVEKTNIEISDIFLINYTRKLALISFIEKYTEKPAEILEITKEIERVFSRFDLANMENYTIIREEDLRASESRLREAQKLAKLGNWEFNYSKNISLHLSDELIDIYEIGSRDMTLEGLNAAFVSLIPKHELDLYLKKTKEAAEGLGRFYIEYGIRTPSGTEKCLCGDGYAFINSNNDIIIRGITQDITERKRAENEITAAKKALEHLNTNLEQTVAERTAELEESRKQLKLVIDGIPALVSYMDANGKYVFVNATYGAWFNKPVKYFIGKTAKEVFPEGYAIIEKSLQRAANGEEVQYQTKAPYPTGTRDVQVSYIPYKNTKGELSGFIILVIDISRQKMLEESIRQREQEIRFIADSVPAGISYIDKDERYRFANKAAVQSSQLGKELIGNTVKEVAPDLYKQMEHYLKTGLAGNTVTYDLNFQNDNIERTVRIKYIPDKGEDGTVKGMISLVTDITNDKIKEKELQKKNEELIKINNDLDNFIYTASHDLKAPVSNIEGLLYALSDSLAEKQKLDEETNSFISLIKTSVLRFQTTIKELTEVSKAQRNIEDDVQKLDLRDMLEEVKLNLRPLIEESAAMVEVQLTEAQISFSRVNMKSILQNLISNAIKYRSEKRLPVVKIRTYISNNYFVLEVADNGLGIKEAYTEKIFQMFKRFHDHVEGTGVGLYIVKRIVDNAGGKVEVISEVDKGTTFRIYLKSSS